MTHRAGKSTAALISRLIYADGKYIFSAVGEGVYSIDTALRGPMVCLLKTNVNNIFIDRGGDIWVAIKDGGVSLLR
ncbi:hypothetical protein, partial [Enterococcus faecium]